MHFKFEREIVNNALPRMGLWVSAQLVGWHGWILHIHCLYSVNHQRKILLVTWVAGVLRYQSRHFFFLHQNAPNHPLDISQERTFKVKRTWLSPVPFQHYQIKFP